MVSQLSDKILFSSSLWLTKASGLKQIRCRWRYSKHATWYIDNDVHSNQIFKFQSVIRIWAHGARSGIRPHADSAPLVLNPQHYHWYAALRTRVPRVVASWVGSTQTRVWTERSSSSTGTSPVIQLAKGWCDTVRIGLARNRTRCATEQPCWLHHNYPLNFITKMNVSWCIYLTFTTPALFLFFFLSLSTFYAVMATGDRRLSSSANHRKSGFLFDVCIWTSFDLRPWTLKASVSPSVLSYSGVCESFPGDIRWFAICNNEVDDEWSQSLINDGLRNVNFTILVVETAGTVFC